LGWFLCKEKIKVSTYKNISELETYVLMSVCPWVCVY
jgi:hypothetical protein